jgi:hypothetical protein
MKRLLSAILLLVSGLVSSPLFAQNAVSANKIAIKFSCTCTDTTGALFATAFRDLLVTSPRYTETFVSANKLPNGKESPNWQIKVVSLDPSPDNSGSSTALSEVFLLGETYYLNQMVQICGRGRTKECASTLLSNFDSYLNSPSQ